MLLKYFATLIPFLVVDGFWLGFVAKKMYFSSLGHLLAEKPALLPALIFYFLYPLGIVIFVLNPALETRQLATALKLGAFLGFLAYATYDLTNNATLKGWPWHITIIDIIWGTFLTALVSGIAFLILSR